MKNSTKKSTANRIRLIRSLAATLAVLPGLAQATFISIDGSDLTPIRGERFFFETAQGNLACSGSAPGLNLFTAQVHLPDEDIRIRRVAAWGNDSVADQDMEIRLTRVCQDLLVGSLPQSSILATFPSATSAGSFFAQSGLLDVRPNDRDRCTYLLSVFFGNSNPCNSSMNLIKARIEYETLGDRVFSSGFENPNP